MENVVTDIAGRWKEGIPVETGWYFVYAYNPSNGDHLFRLCRWNSEGDCWEDLAQYWAELITHYAKPQPPTGKAVQYRAEDIV